MEIPITAISPDQLPAETPIKWDEICKIVGNLYLESYRRVSTMESHFQSIVSQYIDRNNSLQQENDILKKTLEKDG